MPITHTSVVTKRSGVTISDRYQLSELIGRGGFAEVWEATDQRTDTIVAVKLPLRNDGTVSREKIINAFKREWSVFRKLKLETIPSSIIRCFDGRGEDEPYLVLERIDGKELDLYLKKSGHKPGVEALCVFGIPIFRAIEFLHWNNSSYLDLKPENILVREESEKPVLIDFNVTAGDTQGIKKFGADPFKAPEQIQNTSYDYDTVQKADIYATGKLAYFLLTGEADSGRRSPHKAIEKAAESAALPDNVTTVLKQSLLPDPADRLDNVTCLVDSLWRMSSDSQSRIGELISPDGTTECPVRPTDCIGRVNQANRIPDISIADPKQYVSPVHFVVEHDGTSWILRDNSLNGTYVKNGSTWYYLLSAEGYQRLSEETPDRVAEEQPPSSMRIRNQVRISPVDEDYPRSVIFRPG